MRYPVYPDTLERRRPVPEAVELLARRERGFGEGGSFSDRSSLAVGQLCVDLAQSRNTHASRRKKLIKATRPSVSEHSTERMLFDMISFQKSPAYVERSQQALHKRMIDNLRIHLSGDRNGELTGFATEAVATALLTRYAHPGMVVFPTLAHHEKDKALSMHYDIGLTVRGEEAVSGHLLQVKMACQGRCEGATVATSDGSRYSQAIQFVSGCCDLGMDYRSLDDGNNRLIPELLVAEYDDELTPAQVNVLNYYSNSLLHNITNDSLPRGCFEQQIDLRVPAQFTPEQVALTA